MRGYLLGDIFMGTPGDDGLVAFSIHFRKRNISFYFGQTMKSALIVLLSGLCRFVNQTSLIVFIGVGEILTTRHAGKRTRMNSVWSKLVARIHIIPLWIRRCR